VSRGVGQGCRKRFQHIARPQSSAVHGTIWTDGGSLVAYTAPAPPSFLPHHFISAALLGTPVLPACPTHRLFEHGYLRCALFLEGHSPAVIVACTAGTAQHGIAQHSMAASTACHDQPGGSRGAGAQPPTSISFAMGHNRPPASALPLTAGTASQWRQYSMPSQPCPGHPSIIPP